VRLKTHTVPDTTKPLVHLISMPELIEVCLTGNENVKLCPQIWLGPKQ